VKCKRARSSRHDCQTGAALGQTPRKYCPVADVRESKPSTDPVARQVRSVLRGDWWTGMAGL